MNNIYDKRRLSSNPDTTYMKEKIGKKYDSDNWTEGKTYNCPAVSNFFLAFPFHHIDNAQVVSFCCELSLRFPHINLCENGSETIENFISLRKKFISEGLNPTAHTSRLISKVCASCPQYILKKWHNKDTVQMVHLSMSPAPCQSKCIYCEVINMSGSLRDPHVQKIYTRVFDALEYADKIGLISNNASWMISSGEICIHPYKLKIIDMVKDKKATFFTNAFIYDVNIGRILSTNTLSKINLSIDSGTSETWFRIKGVNNFNKIIRNLEQYRICSSGKNQIELKYILLPGINDSLNDYDGIIHIMKKLEIQSLIISRERRWYDTTGINRLLDSAGELVARLQENGLAYSLHSYSPQEKEQVLCAAKGEHDR